VVSVALGVYFLLRSSDIIEVTKRYDDINSCKANKMSPTECTINLAIDDDMTEPVFLYYEIHNMY